MGHTLVAEFDENFNVAMDKIFNGQNNKIPFGRDCDREVANQCLSYHMTLFHWAKENDEIYLPRIEKLIFKPCSLKIIRACILPTKDGNSLLVLKVKPSKSFNDFISAVESIMDEKTNSFFHITLAVDKDRKKVKQMYKELCKSFVMPCELQIKAIVLYHIWNPVKKIQEFSKK